MPDHASADADITIDHAECAREPIHLIGRIQPHGILLVLEGADLRIARISGNAGAALGLTDAGAALDRPLAGVSADLARVVRRVDGPGHETYAGVDGRPYHVALQRRATSTIVELEDATQPAAAIDDPLAVIRTLTQALGDADQAAAVTATADAIRLLTDYDRVMIYRFAPNGDGEVVAEARQPAAVSYAGLRFPATDIPAQARAAFRDVRVRIISDATHAGVPLLPAMPSVAGEVDLGSCGLRGVSPVHLEYLRNMEVQASLTAAITVDGGLWGLIACHHLTPRGAAPALRGIADLVASLLSTRLAALLQQRFLHAQARADLLQRELLASFTAESSDWPGDLMRPEVILPLVQATGAILYLPDLVIAIGDVRQDDRLQALRRSIMARIGQDDLLAVESLAEAFPELAADPALGGLLAVRLSSTADDLLVWTRPEIAQAISWAGDPHQAATRDPRSGRISPRRSFATWTERIRGHCLPWNGTDLSTARAVITGLRGAVGQVYRVREVLRESNRRFRSFSHRVAHDLQEPLRTIAGFGEIIQRRYGAALPEQGRDYLRQVIDGGHRLQVMIVDILALAAVQGVDAPLAAVELQDVMQEVLASLRSAIAEHGVALTASGLPTVMGHRRLLVQLLQNLIGNAIKYRSDRPPAIALTATRSEGLWQIAVADNGIGIAQRDHQRMFAPFTRLAEDSPVAGSGIGLAICKSIIEQHRGDIWVDSELGVGTTITFTLAAAGPADG